MFTPLNPVRLFNWGAFHWGNPPGVQLARKLFHWDVIRSHTSPLRLIEVVPVGVKSQTTAYEVLYKMYERESLVFHSSHNPWCHYAPGKSLEFQFAL